MVESVVVIVSMRNKSRRRCQVLISYEKIKRTHKHNWASRFRIVQKLAYEKLVGGY